MAREPGVKSVSTWVGSGVPRFYLPLDQIFPQTNVSHSSCCPSRCPSARCCASGCRAAGQEFPEVRGRVKLLPNGPPVPYPVQFRVVGSDPAWCCASWADQRQGGHARQPEHARRERQLERKVKVLRLEVDQDKARALGVSSQAIAQARAPSSAAAPSASTARATS
jgi:multidrug efflux pump